ncbi:uncharacterized protein [Acropora muricata]|uniref:uncharacterized protein n=1 Tax=Acropora muricata TaxID=159855 RepID=UPI0034E56A70
MADESERPERNSFHHKRKHKNDPQPKKGKEKKSTHQERKHKRKKTEFIQPRAPKTAAEMSSNWKALQAILQKEREQKEKNGEVKHKSRKTFQKVVKPIIERTEKRKSEIWFDDVNPEDIKQVAGTMQKIPENSSKMPISRNMKHLTKSIALDCEMVGVGRHGSRNMLARVSIIDSHGNVLYDSFVAPQEKVVDYRTFVSGVKPNDLINAPDFKTVQNKVSKLLKGQVLVGHALKNDLKVLFLSHPRKYTRDTAQYKPFQEELKSTKPALRSLAKHFLDINIQQGEHNSVQDAQAAMKLYLMHKNQWERQIRQAKLRRFRTKKANNRITQDEMT